LIILIWKIGRSSKVHRQCHFHKRIAVDISQYLKLEAAVFPEDGYWETAEAIGGGFGLGDEQVIFDAVVFNYGVVDIVCGHGSAAPDCVVVEPVHIACRKYNEGIFGGNGFGCRVHNVGRGSCFGVVVVLVEDYGNAVRNVGWLPEGIAEIGGGVVSVEV